MRICVPARHNCASLGVTVFQKRSSLVSNCVLGTGGIIMRHHFDAFVTGTLITLMAGGALAQPTCLGDFDGDQQVTVDELVTSVNNALAGCPPPEPRFVNNGDGTVTDHQTGLMWEQKVAFDQSPVECIDGSTCPDPHDADNLYSLGTSATASDGTAFTVFLAQLNDLDGGGTNCFADQCDWRLPTIAELSTIVDYGRDQPAIDPVFDDHCRPNCTLMTCGCTLFSNYWSSTTYVPSPNNAWTVIFGNGFLAFNAKTGNHAVRAVRGGPASGMAETLP